MKKKLAIVLAVAMMAGVIAGCGSKDNSGSASSGGAASVVMQQQLVMKKSLSK